MWSSLLSRTPSVAIFHFLLCRKSEKSPGLYEKFENQSSLVMYIMKSSHGKRSLLMFSSGTTFLLQWDVFGWSKLWDCVLAHRSSSPQFIIVWYWPTGNSYPCSGHLELPRKFKPQNQKVVGMVFPWWYFTKTTSVFLISTSFFIELMVKIILFGNVDSHEQFDPSRQNRLDLDGMIMIISGASEQSTSSTLTNCWTRVNCTPPWQTRVMNFLCDWCFLKYMFWWYVYIIWIK